MSTVANAVAEHNADLAAKVLAAQELVRQQVAVADPQKVCVTSSFQAEDMAVVHMVRAILPDVPVIFLDTGYHFVETYEYRDRLADEWHLNLVNVLPEMTVAVQEEKFGILHQLA